MALRKLCLLTILAVVVASAAVANNMAFAPNTSLSYRCEQVAKIPGPLVMKAILAKKGIPTGILRPAQSRDVNKLGVGKLLVASRDLGDPHFAKTVILLVHYDAEGVLGLILNRRTDIPLSRVFEGLKAAEGRSDPVYAGGPVEIPVVFGLLQSPAKVEGAEKVFSGVYLLSTKSLFEESISHRADRNVFHVYLGYAGWNMNQLRMEVDLGSWFIFPGDAKTVFDSDPDTLWSRMIAKTEQKLAGKRPGQSRRLQNIVLESRQAARINLDCAFAVYRANR